VRSRNSSVSIVTRLWAGRPGFYYRQGQGLILFTTASRHALWPTQPPIQCVLWDLSPGVKWPRREADHSLPSRAEVKNAWRYTSTSLIRFYDVVLNEAQDTFSWRGAWLSTRKTSPLYGGDMRTLFTANIGSKIPQLVTDKFIQAQSVTSDCH
jgi:hypothetical protein